MFLLSVRTTSRTRERTFTGILRRGDVYAHPRDASGRIRGEGEPIGTWDDLVNDYPKRGGPR
jgi:hypothetical protein